MNCTRTGRFGTFSGYGAASLLPSGSESLSCDQIRAQKSLAGNSGSTALAKAYDALAVVKGCAWAPTASSGTTSGSASPPAAQATPPVVLPQGVPADLPATKTNYTPYAVGGLALAALAAWYFLK